MDKLFFTIFLSTLAVFITAVLSIVKLVNEKESKITDYRQAWTDSVRKTFAELIGQINEQAAQLNRLGKVASMIDDVSASMIDKDSKEEKHNEDYKKTCLNEFEELNKRVKDARCKIYEAYAFACLHFKPNDLSFYRIEQKFESIMAILQDLQASNDRVERAELKQKVFSATNELSGFSRDILKTEWEAVKRGEQAYLQTKKWSIRGFLAVSVLLVCIGGYAVISIPSQSSTASVSVPTQQKNP